MHVCCGRRCRQCMLFINILDSLTALAWCILQPCIQYMASAASMAGAGACSCTGRCGRYVVYTKPPRAGRRSSRTFSTDFEIFWCFDSIVIYFFNSNFKFFDDASEFSVTSLYIVLIFSSKFMLIFLQSVFYREAIARSSTVLIS